MKQYLTIVFAVLSCITLVAQNTTQLKGRVETADKKPAEFAVVTLLSAADSSLVKGAITETDGQYHIDAVAPGNYMLTATLTGFSKYWHGPFEIAAGTSELTIPLITLAVAAELKG
ncbi:MAG: carboxypeptidase-like regulatory domain-containing protein, partial [Bacteroidia bacterium]